jgi:hypothetical protein
MHTQVPWLSSSSESSWKQGGNKRIDGKLKGVIGLVKIKIIASDELTPSFLHASEEFCGQSIQNGPSDEPTV